MASSPRAGEDSKRNILEKGIDLVRLSDSKSDQTRQILFPPSFACCNNYVSFHVAIIKVYRRYWFYSANNDNNNNKDNNNKLSTSF